MRQSSSCHSRRFPVPASGGFPHTGPPGPDYDAQVPASGTDNKYDPAAYVEAEVDGEVRWGIGVDQNIVTASLRAVASAVNRR